MCIHSSACRRADKSDKKLRTATGRARVCRDNCTALAINYRPPRCRSPRDRWLCVLPVAANGRRYLICITPTFSTGTTCVEHIKINDQKSRSHDAARPPATGRPPPGTDSGRFTARSSARRAVCARDSASALAAPVELEGSSRERSPSRRVQVSPPRGEQSFVLSLLTVHSCGTLTLNFHPNTRWQNYGTRSHIN